MGVKLRERKLDSGKVSLYLDIYHKGKRSYEFLDLHLANDKQQNKEVKRLAEAIRSKREIQLYNDHYDFEKKDSDLLFTDFMESIAEDFKERGNRNVHSVLYHVRKYDSKNIKFNDLTESWVIGFKKYLLKEVKQNTARTYFLILRSVLNKATGRGHMKGNPIYKFDIDNIAKDPPKIEYVTEKELKRLWKADCKNVDVKRGFLFSVYTGLRFSDVEGLTWDDIRLIEDDNKGEKYYQVDIQQKKTKELIHIPISKKAEPLIEIEKKFSDQVFDISESKVQYWLPKWGDNAKIKKHIHFHMARHTFATRLLRRGVDIFTVVN